MRELGIILIALVMFFAGLILLVKGADFLIDGAESLAVRAGVSPTTIGLTVVAFGTSLPELLVTTEAYRLGDYAIGTGNIVGSNIVNIGLILALGYIIMPASGSTAESRHHLIINSILIFGAALAFALLSLRGFLTDSRASCFWVCSPRCFSGFGGPGKDRICSPRLTPGIPSS